LSDTDGASAYQRESLRYATGAHVYKHAPFLIIKITGGNNMNIPQDLKFTKNDEWIKVEGDTVTIGITDFAQEQLSDVVFVEILVNEGDIVSVGDSCATIESVKAAAEVYIPVEGKVIAINETLMDTPEIINTDPYGDAWMVKIKFDQSTDFEPLMSGSEYLEKIQEN
jgi:glycine cleavage system H protein